MIWHDPICIGNSLHLTLSKYNKHLSIPVRFLLVPLKRTVTTLVARILHSVVQRPQADYILWPNVWSVSSDQIGPVIKLPSQEFQKKCFSLHLQTMKHMVGSSKLHSVARIKSTKRRPCWGKDVIKMPGLERVPPPQFTEHPSGEGNSERGYTLRIKPPRWSQGAGHGSPVPRSTGEWVQWHVSPLDQEAMQS